MLEKADFIKLARAVARYIDSNDISRVLNNYHMNTEQVRATINHFGFNTVCAWLAEYLPMSENELFYNI